jgi:hypothetical protein
MGNEEAAWLRAELSASLNARSAFAGAPVKICVSSKGYNQAPKFGWMDGRQENDLLLDAAIDSGDAFLRSLL